jgi:hypothetical protein
MIRINFGNLMFKSCLDDVDDSVLFKVYPNFFKNSFLILLNEKVKEQVRFYTKYKLELSDLRILYSDSSILIYLTKKKPTINSLNWIDRKKLYILRRTPLIDINFYKCIYSNDANLTK